MKGTRELSRVISLSLEQTLPELTGVCLPSFLGYFLHYSPPLQSARTARPLPACEVRAEMTCVTSRGCSTSRPLPQPLIFPSFLPSAGPQTRTRCKWMAGKQGGRSLGLGTTPWGQVPASHLSRGCEVRRCRGILPQVGNAHPSLV